MSKIKISPNGGGLTIGKTLKIAGVSAASSLLTGLVSYWKLGETQNSNRVDSVGVNDLTPVTSNLVNPTQETGIIGNCAGFVPGNGNHLDAADHSSLDFSTAFTVQAWIWATSFSGNAGIISKWNYSTDGGWVVSLNLGADQIRVWIADSPTDGGSNTVTSTDASLSTSTWQHLLVRYNAGTVKINLNNTVLSLSTTGTIPSSLLNNTTSLAVGSWPDTLNRHWSGRLDEVALWSRELTDLEATTLYGAGTGLQYPF